MTLSELFTLREGTESRVNQYWTFWSVSIFAVCGWLFTDSANHVDGVSSVFIAIGLLFFFVANLSVLTAATKFSLLVHDEICEQVKKSELSDVFKTKITDGRVKYRMELTIAMHLIIDVALLTVLILKGWKVIELS